MKELRFFVDRVSEGTAVLLADGGGLTAPLSLLPEGTREGDYLRASFELDDGRRANARGEIDRLMDDLEDNP